jgi:ZIP family zinc transporter
MTTFDLEEREAVAEFGRAWWIFLVTGILWFLVSIIILRFDYTSVSAISILFGIVAIFAGGAILTMLADTMMPEAFAHGGRYAGIMTTVGFATAFAVSAFE